MGHTDAQSIKKQVRSYMMVFASLLFLTFVTVAISRLHLSVGKAIALGLLVATVKGSLVACYFMHLLSERKFIYGTLLLTVFFFVVLLGLPVSQLANEYKGIEHLHPAVVPVEVHEHGGEAH